MAKEVIKQVKLQVPAGKANPAPPLGPALGQAGVQYTMTEVSILLPRLHQRLVRS